MSDLRHLPSVDKLLNTPEPARLIAENGRPLTLTAIRETLDEIRLQLSISPRNIEPAEILKKAAELISSWLQPTLIPVINASGVILHTNLGRAPLSQSALQAISQTGCAYNTLEFDLASGKRGSREIHAQALLTRLTGAEAALVVNNNAAAVLLVLTALARRRAVVISRTQLVEIGGGFRVPEVMKQSGARLVEVGTTNRVHLDDYENAIASQKPVLVLHAHHSNFRLVGFTAEPQLSELVQCAHHHEIPVVDDLGSGALLDTSVFGLAHEPTVQESLLAGSDVVCFSGDKLLGGPQAGIIVGRKIYIEKIKKHPLMRAVRSDKLCLAALSATLYHYLKDEAVQQIPVWQMIARPSDQILETAQRWSEILGKGEILSGNSTVGGGSLPGETLPTHLLTINVPQPQKIITRLRNQTPPIIARIEADLLVFDPRTVLLEQEQALLYGIYNALNG